MATAKIGERVGAVMMEDEDLRAVHLFGYGVYEGDFPLGEDGQAAGDVADVVRARQAINPRIRLDDGKAVWGAECWWGPEDRIQTTINGRLAAGWKLVHVDIDEQRAKVAEHRKTMEAEREAFYARAITFVLTMSWQDKRAGIPPMILSVALLSEPNQPFEVGEYEPPFENPSVTRALECFANASTAGMMAMALGRPAFVTIDAYNPEDPAAHISKRIAAIEAQPPKEATA